MFGVWGRDHLFYMPPDVGHPRIFVRAQELLWSDTTRLVKRPQQSAWYSLKERDYNVHDSPGGYRYLLEPTFVPLMT